MFTLIIKQIRSNKITLHVQIHVSYCVGAFSKFINQNERVASAAVDSMGHLENEPGCYYKILTGFQHVCV